MIAIFPDQTTLWYSPECGGPIGGSKYNDSVNTGFSLDNYATLVDVCMVQYLENSRIIAAVRMTTYAGTLLPHGGTTPDSQDDVFVRRRPSSHRDHIQR